MQIFSENTRVKYNFSAKNCELGNHLGNVLTVVSDRKIAVVNSSAPTVVAYFSPEIITANDYYCFGFEMKGRSVNSGTSYLYGFNGKRKDTEGLGGGGSTYDYGFRIYNPSLGKFLSVDPLTKNYAMLTPYQFASNAPINCIDVDGLEAVEVGKDNPFLIIVVLGRNSTFSDDIVNGNTLYKNLPDNQRAEDDGLTDVKSLWPEITPTIITYAGSSDTQTSDDVAETIRNYRATNPEGKIVLIGHSLGGKNVIDAALKVYNDEKIENKTIEAVITLEPAAVGSIGPLPYSQTLQNNVKNSITYNSASGTNGPGGEIKKDAKDQKYVSLNLRKSTDHTNMDNSLVLALDVIIKFIFEGYDAVDVAKEIDYSKLKTYDNGERREAGY